MFETTPIAWHNGRIGPRELAAPSIASHSLHLGIGVFDGMMAYWNGDHYYIHRMAAHLERFRGGAGKIGLDFAWSSAEMADGIRALLAQVSAGTYYIRPIAYRSAPQINVTGSGETPVDVAIFGVTAPRDVQRVLRCHISPYERVSNRAIPVGWKLCGTYINSYLARSAAQAAGFDDGIMLNQSGAIAEASAANIFFLEADRLVTPSAAANVFPGITRDTLIDIAAALGIGLEEREVVMPTELSGFEGAFLASTLMELKPISQIESHCYRTESHPLYRRLLAAFQEITHQ